MLRVREASSKDMDRLRKDIVVRNVYIDICIDMYMYSTCNMLWQLFFFLQDMKQQRVRLMKQLRTENQAFANYRKEKEREVIQLRAHGRKRELQMKKMEGQMEMQKAVLKVSPMLLPVRDNYQSLDHFNVAA